jgi:hypothetical protein
MMFFGFIDGICGKTHQLLHKAKECFLFSLETEMDKRDRNVSEIKAVRNNTRR